MTMAMKNIITILFMLVFTTTYSQVITVDIDYMVLDKTDTILTDDYTIKIDLKNNLFIEETQYGKSKTKIVNTSFGDGLEIYCDDKRFNLILKDNRSFLYFEDLEIVGFYILDFDNQ